MAGNDGNVPQEPQIVGLPPNAHQNLGILLYYQNMPPNVPQHFTYQQFLGWQRRNHMTTQNDYLLQQQFLGGNILTDTYLAETGFRDKKLMWGSRTRAVDTNQLRVLVSPYKCQYMGTNDPYEERNCLKVAAVVFPRLRPVVNNLVNNERVYEEIVAARIPGCYLYTKIASYNPVANNSLNKMSGTLYTVRIMRTLDPLDPRISKGLITGVLPYYKGGRGYVPYMQFNLLDQHVIQYQQRFTDFEREPGINDANVTNACKYLRDYARVLAGEPLMNPLPTVVNGLSAIYVPKYVTLVVFFTNSKYNAMYRQIDISNGGEITRFHERLLIQAGGLVTLVNCPLYYRFMNDPKGTEFSFKDIYSWILRPTVTNEARFWDMHFLMHRVVHPLIVLGEYDDPGRGNDLPPYAGYFLEIRNYDGVEKRAVLEIPFQGFFNNVYELGRNIRPEYAVTPYPPTFGMDFLENEAWKVNPQTFCKAAFTEFTGPYNRVKDINWYVREAFP